MSIDDLHPGLNSDEFVVRIEGFLDSVRVAEDIGRTLCRLLQDFLDREVLPPAMRAAEQGTDPTPILATAAAVLEAFAGSLSRPSPGGEWPSELGERKRP